MDRKSELIKEMLEMQATFTAHEQSGEYTPEDYYVEGKWKEYRERYTKIATEVREIASEEANFWK